MPDYTGLTEQEYIDLLNARDVEIDTLNQTITDKDNEISTLNTTIQSKDTEIATLHQTVSDKDVEISTLTQSVADRDNQIAVKDTEITALNQTIADQEVIIDDKIAEVEDLNQTIDAMKTPDGSLFTINQLSVADKQKLAHKVRTTNEGIKTFFAVNYGAEAPQEALAEEEN